MEFLCPFAPFLADGGGAISSLVGKFHVEWPLLIAQTLNFCVVAFVLHRFAFRPLMAAVAERQRKIAEGLRCAEEVRNRLARVEEERENRLKEAAREARNVVEKARVAAKDFSEKERKQTVVEMDAMEARARKKMEEERAAALGEAQLELKGAVVDLTRKLLSDRLDGEIVARLTADSARSIASR